MQLESGSYVKKPCSATFLSVTYPNALRLVLFDQRISVDITATAADETVAKLVLKVFCDKL